MDKILSLHLDHDGSATYVVNNKVVFHTQLDRYNRLKHSALITKNFLDYLYKLEFDVLIITFLYFDNVNILNSIFHTSKRWIDKLQKVKVIQYGKTEHHLFHAYGALTWNKFDNCKVIVMDGAGANKPTLYSDKDYENETVFTYNKHLSCDKRTFLKLGKRYETISKVLMGDCWFKEGKTMALSLYGKYTSRAFPKDPIPEIKKTNQKIKDLAYTLQFCTEKDVLGYFKDYEDQNILFTGGVVQNVLINSKLEKQGRNIFFDPFNGDFGISLGAANYFTKNKIRIDNINLGIPQKLSFNNTRSTTVNEVAQLLLKEPVAIFQSRSEQGQRGLGYRSLLISPTCKQAYKKINEIKKREWYRPFALSCLKEETHKWFDTNKDSPYMMKVYKLKNKENIRTGYAIDDSCRVQTVDKSNIHYYNLLKEVHKITKVPMLVNTSLNLPGEVLVETPQDLEELMKKSKLKYVYIPEVNKLLSAT